MTRKQPGIGAEEKRFGVFIAQAILDSQPGFPWETTLIRKNYNSHRFFGF
jgi:hypothetical protein